MRLTPAVVEDACKGLSLAADESIHRENHLFAKLSRPETRASSCRRRRRRSSRRYSSAACSRIAKRRLAAHVPLAEDITVEADSEATPTTGGHGALARGSAPSCNASTRYARSPRVGAAGGIGTPAAAAAAFALAPPT